MNIMEKFGGSMWDTLFLLVKDNDSDFIFDFVNRLPCEKCINNFNKCIRKNNISFHEDKNEIYKKLWTMRCKMNEAKYKDNLLDLNEYLKYLCILND
tara:strand:- start:289 stop:579 length:291 start_codon:yes stop_codon:yes gene_type:complete